MTIQNLKFEQIIDPEEIKLTHLHNGDTWKGTLDLDGYVERENLLGTTGIAKKQEQIEVQKRYPELANWLGIRYFALKQDDRIVSSCETLTRLGYCISSSSQSGIDTNLVVCLGAVFTPAKYRGKGYASSLLRKLLQFYDNARETPDAPPGVKQMVLTLYSEVGEYYKQFGFHSVHVPVHRITQVDAFLKYYCKDYAEMSGKPLDEKSYNELVQLQNEGFREHMRLQHKSHPHSYIFTVKSDADIYEWFNARDKFILQKTLQTTPEALKFGFVLNDKSHVLWHHSWGESTLVLVKIYIHPHSFSKESDILKELFAHAVMETKSTGLKRIEFWDEDIPIKKFPILFKALNDLEHDSMVYAENHSLSAVRPPPQYNIDDVIWDNNGKYCWF
ncbi:YGR111W [Zygosaccharomyces parabailii]|nr:YGR111W [Zygosaccharomyces parabailii]CDH14302.1 uncharacterized protein ZBAI_06088 [Zygosaccharomyces bailii ISA1307]